MFLSDSDGFIFGLPWPSKTARQVLCTGCLPYGLRTRRTYNGPDESGRWGRVTDFVALLSDSLEEGREGNLKRFFRRQARAPRPCRPTTGKQLHVIGLVLSAHRHPVNLPQLLDLHDELPGTRHVAIRFCRTFDVNLDCSRTRFQFMLHDDVERLLRTAICLYTTTLYRRRAHHLLVTSTLPPEG